MPVPETSDYLHLDGRAVVVTGATSGIGFEAAKALLAAGARLVVSGSSQESAESAAGKRMAPPMQ